MPKSRVAKKRMFREFSKLHSRYVPKNYLKNIRALRKDFSKRNNIREKHLEFMLWAYDLEFFTINYASDEMGICHRITSLDYIFYLTQEGFLYKHFNRLTDTKDPNAQMFREDTKFNYRVRYALSQKGRLLVSRFYNELEESWV
jgi:hypothetical protein